MDEGARLYALSENRKDIFCIDFVYRGRVPFRDIFVFDGYFKYNIDPYIIHGHSEHQTFIMNTQDPLDLASDLEVGINRAHFYRQQMSIDYRNPQKNWGIARGNYKQDAFMPSCLEEFLDDVWRYEDEIPSLQDDLKFYLDIERRLQRRDAIEV
jgi:hypothetical protein